GACFLALGRALGETMAVTMLIGNKATIEWSPFALGNTIASVIANEYTEATYDLYLSALTELGLVLLLVTVVVNFLARLLIWRVGRVRNKSSLWAQLRTLWHSPASSKTPVALQALKGDRRLARARWIDRLMTGILGACVLVTVGPLFFILGYL